MFAGKPAADQLSEAVLGHVPGYLKSDTCRSTSAATMDQLSGPDWLKSIVGDQVVTACTNGTVKLDDTPRTKLLALYFSAHW